MFINGLPQDSIKSSALALELPQTYAKPPICINAYFTNEFLEFLWYAIFFIQRCGLCKPVFLILPALDGEQTSA